MKGPNTKIFFGAKKNYLLLKFYILNLRINYV